MSDTRVFPKIFSHFPENLFFFLLTKRVPCAILFALPKTAGGFDRNSRRGSANITLFGVLAFFGRTDTFFISIRR